MGKDQNFSSGWCAFLSITCPSVQYHRVLERGKWHKISLVVLSSSSVCCKLGRQAKVTCVQTVTTHGLEVKTALCLCDTCQRCYSSWKQLWKTAALITPKEWSWVGGNICILFYCSQSIPKPDHCSQSIPKPDRFISIKSSSTQLSAANNCYFRTVERQ